MPKETRTFTLERLTKNTVRYQEDSGQGAPICGTIYIQKWFAGNSQKVRVVIETLD